jgi:hypothetical protein
MPKYSKETLLIEIKKLLVEKYGVDEEHLGDFSTLGEELNLGVSEIQELILDVCEKDGNFDYEEVLNSIDEDLEDLTVSELSEYIADSLKID